MLKMFSDLIVGDTFIIGSNGYVKLGFNKDEGYCIITADGGVI